jgi:hypothetical protein
MALSLNSPYEIESDTEDNCSYPYDEHGEWPHPFACRGFPDVTTMIRFSYLPPKEPKPLAPYILEMVKEGAEKKKSAAADLSAAESVLKKMSGELKVAEEEIKKTYAWSNRTGKQQNVDRLKIQANSAVQARADAVKKLDEITQKYKNVEEIVQLQEDLVSVYQRHEELMAGFS